MAYINSKGSPNSPVWVVVEGPVAKDKEKGFIYSSGMGYVWDKMMREAGIPDYYVISRRCDFDDVSTYRVIENELEHYKPSVIIAIEEAGKFFCKELIKNEFATRKIEPGESEISKYCGSLLTTPAVNYPHRLIPSYGPEHIIRNWSLRDIVISFDLAKATREIEYVKANGIPEPFTERTLHYDIQHFDEILRYLDDFKHYDIISNDIETVYPKGKKSEYKYHPGLPVSISLAVSPTLGIAFEPFRESITETRELWRRLQIIFDRCQTLGQNFFAFDWYRYQMLGFRINRKRIIDTMLRQHVLFPEMPKTLQFMTRQYTREPYYKDEGHGWSLKNMTRLKRYNCLDTTVTYEVYLGQEEEFDARPYLR